MSDIDKLKNILSFLCILFGEKHDVMETIFDFSPEYIMEKYERYIKSDRREWPWGMHLSLRKGHFLRWLEKHKVEMSEDNAEIW